MKYKALLCDVDGTLVPNRRGGVISKRVIEAVNKASIKIPVGIATARSYWEAVPILDAVSFSSPCIITGGAQIIDPKTRKTFFERTIAPEDVKKCAELAREFNISIKVANRDGEYDYSEKHIPLNPLDLYTNAISDELAQKYAKSVSHIPTVITHKTVAWGDEEKVHITITHTEASKQDAILEVARLLDINTHEIIGIGEGYNDFPFLMACGLKVAMSNGVKELKEIADYIAPSVDEDGVADVIEKFVL